MPSSPTQQEETRVDHRAEARRLLQQGIETPTESLEQAGRDVVDIALVHSQLAVADELKGIRESVAGFDAAKIEGALIAEIEHVGREIIEIVWRANGGRS